MLSYPAFLLQPPYIHFPITFNCSPNIKSFEDTKQGYIRAIKQNIKH